MFEVGADGSSLDRVFRVGDRALIVIALCLAIASLVPLSSIHELVTTGTIDMNAVSPTRRRIPIWILYTAAWPIFLAALWGFLPAFRYLISREMFRLGQQGITIGGVTLAPEEVLGFGYSLMRGHVLRSTRGEFPIHPWMVKGGVEALAEALPHIPPLKKGELPDWALD